MKKLLLILLCLPIIGFAQTVPQGINYQAVARDANGDELTNQTLTVKLSVISGSSTGTLSWQETHPVTTNDFGLFTAVIGQGTSTSVGSSTTFNVVDWGSASHYIKVEIDNGSGYVDMGTTELMSVPYAIHSTPQSLTISGDTLFISSGNYIILPSSTPNLQIGDFYQGGIIFWLDGNGGGLIAAATDQSIGAEWGCYGTSISGADGTAIGTGAQNTIDIINANCSPYYSGYSLAANICDALTLGGYSDWFLPSKDELNEMYLNIGGGNAFGLGNIGGFANNKYWSSTETGINSAWRQYFGNGGQSTTTKNVNYYVRAVRAF